MRLEDATENHITAIADIYGHYVLHSTATFEETPPGMEEMYKRFLNITNASLPYLVAVERDDVVGYAYAAPYNTRSAYRYTLEDSVYIAPSYGGKGIGSLLLKEIIARVKTQGYKQLIAKIGGGSENTASIALHSKCGFYEIGTFAKVGYKFDRWVDITLMQFGLE